MHHTAPTEREIDEVGGRVAEPLDDDLFMEAFDLLEDLRARAGDQELATEMSFRLATAKFIAGQHTEAAVFEDVADAAFEPSDGDAVERHLDALASLMRLYAAGRRPGHRIEGRGSSRSVTADQRERSSD